jgi:NAD(P)-dependent dehydrogenase (short-subunit alcohol dehydrogenase family)
MRSAGIRRFTNPAALSARRSSKTRKAWFARQASPSAAVSPIGPLVDHTSETLLTALTLMAVAPARLTSALAWRLEPGGRVLNLSTRSAFATFPGLSLYCMSKHALHSLSRSLQLELPPAIAVVRSEVWNCAAALTSR